MRKMTDMKTYREFEAQASGLLLVWCEKGRHLVPPTLSRGSRACHICGRYTTDDNARRYGDAPQVAERIAYACELGYPALVLVEALGGNRDKVELEFRRTVIRALHIPPKPRSDPPLFRPLFPGEQTAHHATVSQVVNGIMRFDDEYQQERTAQIDQTWSDVEGKVWWTPIRSRDVQGAFCRPWDSSGRRWHVLEPDTLDLRDYIYPRKSVMPEVESAQVDRMSRIQFGRMLVNYMKTRGLDEEGLRDVMCIPLSRVQSMIRGDDGQAIPYILKAIKRLKPTDEELKPFLYAIGTTLEALERTAHFNCDHTGKSPPNSLSYKEYFGSNSAYEIGKHKALAKERREREKQAGNQNG